MKLTKETAAIVTGGGSGMGAAAAKALAAAGAKVALLDIQEKNVAAVAKGIRGLAIPCDVADAESANTALAKARAAHGPARILVHCAGILTGARILSKEGPADLGQFARTVNVNLVGTFNMLRLVASDMAALAPVTKSGERGIIINTASIAAFEGQIGQAAYAASKGGVVALTLPAARELARSGIRVMAIAPGAAATPMIGGLPQDIQDSIAATIPFPSRFVAPEEFASLVLHIVENEMLNGAVIRLDGATRLAPK